MAIPCGPTESSQLPAMRDLLFVALGGALGSVARAVLGPWLERRIADWLPAAPLLPWGTLVINVLGSCAIAVLAALACKDRSGWWAFLATGCLGGFTTFSSFSLQTVELLRVGRTGEAFGYVALSVAGCLAGAALGFWLAGR